MKIVHLVNYFTTGRGYQEYFLAKEQVKEGHEVFIITSDRCSYAAASAFSEKERKKVDRDGERIVGIGVYEEEGIIIHRLPVLFEVFPRIYLKKLKRTLTEIKPDVVHCHGITHIHALQVALIKKKDLDFRLIYDDHMLFMLERKTLLGKLFYLFFKFVVLSLFLRKADAFVAITEETKIFMNKKFGIPLKKINLIHLGADSNSFYFSTQDRVKVRQRLGLKDDDILVIYVGKITVSKNIIELLESCAYLLKHNMIKMLLIGNYDEDYRKRLDAFIAKKGIGDKVIFKEFVANSELYKYYSAADIGVWPGSSTISTLEASSCSLPIIIKEQLGSMGVRISNNNGFAYKEGNLDQLKDYIKLLATNDDLRRQMGENGRKLIENKLSWEKINQEFIIVYK